MITIKLCGGLGNQMFQYALGRRLSVTHNTPLTLDISAFRHDPLRTYRLHNFYLCTHELQDNPSSPTPAQSRFSRVLNKFFAHSNLRYIEPHFEFDENVLKIKRGVLEGYWQSEKYFANIRPLLLKDFALKPSLRPEAAHWASLTTKSDTVSVHIRRGDYVTNQKAQAFHGLVDLEWYTKAINHIRRHVERPQFFFFSDDLAWVRENFSQSPDFHYVDTAPDGFEHEDMYLMSTCKHQIIANSSFSWWAAWLNSNDKKIVIAPQRWFHNQSANPKDLIPANWVCFDASPTISSVMT